ncbi:MAG: NAD-dependent epimerase/dehydratase family protein, partial [Pedobacter sp.]
MKALITGGSGFLGKVIYAELEKNWDVITISRNQGTLNLDLSKEIPLLPQIDLVVHAAGKAHIVPKSSTEIEDFHEVNVTGSKNLLTGLEQMPLLPKHLVFVSSVAVYGCEIGLLINEEHPLNAKDPYGLSKIGAESLIKDWCLKNNVICSILRLPLIVGLNPPGNLRAMINGIKKGYYFNIDKGKARKSMVMANDVANIIPIVSKIGGTYNLTDRYHPSFFELSN